VRLLAAYGEGETLNFAVAINLACLRIRRCR
jgi:hypothetical protein